MRAWTYVAAKGRRLAMPADAEHLAPKVLVMGWARAPFLARSTLQACAARGLGEGSIGARLVYGAPTPQLVGADGEEALNWACMDDCGAMGASASTQGPASEVAGGLAARIKSYLAMVEGEGPESLGAAIEGRPNSVCLCRDRARAPPGPDDAEVGAAALLGRGAARARRRGSGRGRPSSRGRASRSSTRSTAR